MWKWAVAFGVILMFSGVILASTWDLTQEGPKLVLIAKTIQEWSVSANLGMGDKMEVGLRPGSNWIHGPFEADEHGHPFLYVYIEIEDPQGNSTEFVVTLTVTEAAQTLVIWSFNITRHNGLDTTPLYDEKYGRYIGVGGTVENGGIHTVTVEEISPPRLDEPPYSLTIFREEIVIEQPYTYFLPTAIVVVVTGATISLFGLKKRKTSVKKKRKRFSHRRVH